MSDVDNARTRVEAARQQLDDDIATLTDRLPAASVLAAGGAAGGTGLALLGVLAKQVQSRMERNKREQALTREAEIQAKAIAAAMAAAGLSGATARGGDDAPAPTPRPRRVTVPSPSAVDVELADEDDGGTPWGILLLLAGLVAAVVAMVLGGEDDSDLWSTPQA